MKLQEQGKLKVTDTIVAMENSLIANVIGQKPFRAHATGPHKYVSKVNSVFLEFIKSESSGSISGMRMKQHGLNVFFHRNDKAAKEFWQKKEREKKK